MNELKNSCELLQSFSLRSYNSLRCTSSVTFINKIVKNYLGVSLWRGQWAFDKKREHLEELRMPRLLHGTLNVTIYGIDKLRVGSSCSPFAKASTAQSSQGKSLLSRVKTLVQRQPEIAGLYATVDLDRARVARTSIIKMQNSNLIWNENFHIYSAHLISEIIFTVKGENPVGATLIGRARVPVEDVLKGYIVERSVDVVTERGSRVRRNPRIHVKLQFSDVTKDSNWSRGISSPNFQGVPNTFFLQRTGCKVTLYQDAHVGDDFRPRIGLSDGLRYETQRCWEDVFDAITNARHLIYIAGWSVNTEITLVRDPRGVKAGSDVKLGDLLKTKAEDPGMTVLMLVWDDQTSKEEIKRDGLMATHDQETADFFRGSNVRCVLCPRNPGTGRSILQGITNDVVFTHHQKLIVVDAEADGRGSEKRRVVSFIGGIDLCDGRYDTQSHPLFKTLGTVHQNDFHQPNFTGASIKKGGPREPWHDIHCRLEGPVAWDVLYNFEQRWRKQAEEQYLIPMSKLDTILSRPSALGASDSADSWNVQLFRSIDGGAASGFPQAPNTAVSLGLVNEKGNIVDRSIQDAYIHAIRRAKDFIYIENQYFLGSSFDWKKTKDIIVEDIGALHLIPKELSLKIVSKIEAGERFSVYVVVPMWPEGIPESASVQAILDWQRRTMEMMYADISKALQRKGLLSRSHPRDYLTFLCLGNRESEKPDEYKPEQKPEPGSDYIRAQQARRFMIYVHAKMMIVDDEYIIIGSANINQRSMDGARDTEIAMGAYQPQHLATTSGPARNQIHGFRMSLWYEHLRRVDDLFETPQSLQCIRRVNALAEQNWKIYADDSVVGDLPGHLLRYPVEISELGDVTAFEENSNFPDTKAPVLGTKSDYLPYILTT